MLFQPFPHRVEYLVGVPGVSAKDFEVVFSLLVSRSRFPAVSLSTSSFSTTFANNGDNIPPCGVPFCGISSLPSRCFTGAFSMARIMLNSFLSRIPKFHSCRINLDCVFCATVWYRLQYLFHALLNYSVCYRPEMLLYQRYEYRAPVRSWRSATVSRLIFLANQTSFAGRSCVCAGIS